MRKSRFISGRSRIGFTLIELLVVIAIIALLVSILLPSLNKAKELAKQVVCASGEKSIGLAINMYMSDYGVYPIGDCKVLDENGVEWWSSTIPYSAFEVNIPNYDGRWLTNTTLGEYIDDLGVFRCPSYEPQSGNEEWNQSSYAYNAVYLGRRRGGHIGHFLPNKDAPAVNPEDILNPAETVCVVESVAAWVMSPPGHTYYIKHGGVYWWHPYGARWDHNDGMNVLFADGHVFWHPSDDDDDLSNTKNKLWNGTGQEVEPPGEGD